MPSLETDTRMIMAILFVGAVSGVNVFAYALYGLTFPYGPEAHAILFGVSTIGGILMIKVLFDVFLSEFIEENLLQRAITNYWGSKAREEENKRRVRESLRQFDQQYNTGVLTPAYGDTNLPTLKSEKTDTITPKFLTIENQ